MPRKQPIPEQASAERSAPFPGHNPPSTSQLLFGYDPTGPLEQRDIVSSKEGWSEYTLSDGSVIRIKGVLIDVKRAIGQYGLDGNPIYVFQTAFVNSLNAPNEVKKKTK